MTEANGSKPELEMQTIEVPQFMIEAREIPGTGNIMLCLIVSTTGTYHSFFLCMADQNFQAVAKTLHDGIVKAGQEARRAQKPRTELIIPKGVNSDALRVEKQGEVQRRTGGTGTQGPRPT